MEGETMKKMPARLARRLLAALPFLVAASVQAQVVVVAGKGVENMSKDQVSDIFLGKASSLPGGGTAMPIDQPEASPLRDEFYSKVTGKSAAQAKSLWSKLAFTGKGTPPKEAGSSAEVKKTVAGTPGAIGYIEKAAVDDTVKVVFGAQ
jgi:ABC-type phosphate transport system substrate-binding protein